MTPLECLKKFYERVEHFASSYSDLYADEGAISIFSDYGILPSYNYPIYVDELRLYGYPRSQWPRNSLKLQRDRSIALTEYYPGRIIVAGKIPIRSVGHSCTAGSVRTLTHADPAKPPRCAHMAAEPYKG